MNRPRVDMWPCSIAIAMTGGGCAMTVVPPAAPEQPVRVLLVDHGRHASLLFPTDDPESLVEYAYGDWNWFALGRDGALDVFPTLFLPTQGALGRRNWPNFDTPADAEETIPCDVAHVLMVSGASASALRRRLDARFESNIDTRYESADAGLTFVHDDQPYCLLSGCNVTMAEWLRELDCEVRGCSLNADYVVRAR
jgi:hypothetical protein